MGKSHLEVGRVLGLANARLVGHDHAGDGTVGHRDGDALVGAHERAHDIDALHQAHQHRAAARRLQLHALPHHERPRQELRARANPLALLALS